MATNKELTDKVAVLTLENAQLKNELKGPVEPPPEKTERLYWNHPVDTSIGSTQTAFGMQLIQDEAGAWYANVPVSRVPVELKRTTMKDIGGFIAMSEHDLAISNQYEVNAKSPTVVDTVDESLLNMAVGKEFNNELQEFHYGFSAGMGSVSENAEAVLGLELDYLQIQGTNDRVHLGFAAGAQLAGITNIDLILGQLIIPMVWDAGNDNYASAEITGIGDLVKVMVGGRYPMGLVDTTP